MKGAQLIKSIRIANLLSFGKSGESETLRLRPLNVLIGPNASGKSNLIEIIGILQSAPSDLKNAFHGGVYEWMWKGSRVRETAVIDVVIDEESGHPFAFDPIKYHLSFRADPSFQFSVNAETIQGIDIIDPKSKKPFLFYEYSWLRPTSTILRWDNLNDDMDRNAVNLSRSDIDFTQSILSQKKDSQTYPELTFIANQFSKIRLYREWTFGRDTLARRPQPTDLPSDYLYEDASNLALVVNRLLNDPDAKETLLKYLKLLYDGVSDIQTKVEGGTVQIFFHEKSFKHPIPATRLSDGTLRYLCLLSVLCHPSPPPLVCIEEPELGLHPDVIPAIARLLVEASQRMQIIVTTHSETLVSALSDTPEAIVTCEKTSKGTVFKRLEKEQLREWLEKYKLGELWRMGEIGGNR